MAEQEPQVPQVPVETPPVETPPVETSPQAPVGQPTELEALRERVARYEQLVVSPEYAEFLAAKARGAQPTPPQPPQHTAEERQAFQEKLNNMSRLELVAFVRDLTVEAVRKSLFEPVVQTIVTEKVQTQIAQTSAKFPDFWDYKQEMIALSNANPSLSAEQVYHLAKASKPAAPVAPPKPPVRKPGGEVPGGQVPAGTKPAPVDTTFETAFKEAAKRVNFPVT